jgi:hypothetical protein
MAPRQRGDDCLTTFLSGTIGLIFLAMIIVLFLSFLFG